MQKNIELQDNLKSQLLVKPSGFYKKITVPPVGPLNTISAGSSQCVFYVPSGVLNFGLMELQFSVNIPAVAVNNTEICLHADYFPFLYRIELLTTQNNIALCDVIEVDKYGKIVGGIYLNYLKRSSSDGFMFKSNRTVSNAVFGADANNIADPVIGINAASNINTLLSNQGGHAVVSSQLNLFPAVNLYSTQQAALTASFNVSLGDLLPDSIFGINKDIVSENLILRLTFRDRGFIYSSKVIGAFASTAAAADIGIGNMGLNVYSQGNPELVGIINGKNQSGEEIIIPNVQCYTQTYPAQTTSHNTGIRPVCAFNNAHLYKTYTSIFLADAVGFQCNNNNHYAALWTNCSFYLNNELLKQLNCALFEDYKDIKRQFNESQTLDVPLIRASGSVLTTFDSDKINVLEEYNKNE